MPKGRGAQRKNNEKHACKRKIRHDSVHQARLHAASIEAKNGEPYVAYRCRFCPGYHVARASTINDRHRRWAVILADRAARS